MLESGSIRDSSKADRKHTLWRIALYPPHKTQIIASHPLNGSVLDVLQHFMQCIQPEILGEKSLLQTGQLSCNMIFVKLQYEMQKMLACISMLIGAILPNPSFCHFVGSATNTLKQKASAGVAYLVSVSTLHTHVNPLSKLWFSLLRHIHAKCKISQKNTQINNASSHEISS